MNPLKWSSVHTLFQLFLLCEGGMVILERPVGWGILEALGCMYVFYVGAKVAGLAWYWLWQKREGRCALI